MDDIKIFLPFEKKDKDEKIVEGYASTEALDSQGEIVKATAIKQALPEYMKFGNIREMHQWSAVGKTIQAKIDEAKKGLFIRGKIVDKGAWDKVKEGVYNGFSIGGKIKKKVGNVIEELSLNEISLVDRPANPQAVFSLVKMHDGKVKDLQFSKALPVAPSSMEEDDEPENTNVFLADRLVAMAADVAFMIMRCKDESRKTEHLDVVLEALKKAATAELKFKKADGDEKKAEEKKDDKDTLQQLKEAKEKLENLVNSRSFNENWSKDYFETHKEVV